MRFLFFGGKIRFNIYAIKQSRVFSKIYGGEEQRVINMMLQSHIKVNQKKQQRVSLQIPKEDRKILLSHIIWIYLFYLVSDFNGVAERADKLNLENLELQYHAA